MNALAAVAQPKRPVSAEASLGKRYGRLTVFEIVGRDAHGRARVRAKCDCGNSTTVWLGNLRSGYTTSCGCAQRAAAVERGRARRKHGHRVGGQPTPVYRSWSAMVQRCTDSNSDSYPYYGGRGIKICARRAQFVYFLADLGDRPSGTSIDRIDPEGGYSCGKCAECLANGWAENTRWATSKEQRANRRSTASPSES